MAIVRAGPNEYLLVGRKGVLENRGSAVTVYLRPGTIYVLVPSTKQEAAFEFTQETKDGVPLRFKGTFIYRVDDPAAAASMFDFSDGQGMAQITALLTHVCFGELRHTVSHMTMVECIEQRKTTLSGVVSAALAATIHDGGDQTRAWGVRIEAAQVAQVFIVDPALRQQLEAEVRNEIKLRADQSNMHAQEQVQLAELESQGRVQEQKLAGDQAALRREEELELARIARERRARTEKLTTDRQILDLGRDRLQAQLAADRHRVAAEAPVRLLRLSTERRILAEEMAVRDLERQVRELEVERDLLLAKGQQDLRMAVLPLEQAPRIVDSASKFLQGTNLSLYGEGSQLLGQLAPLFDYLARTLQTATRAPVDDASASSTAEPAGAA